MSVADLPPPAAGASGMADDFTGTNSERIDKLVVAVTDMRASQRDFQRNVFLAAGIAVPLLVGLGAYLVMSVGTLAAKHERLAERVDQLDRRLSDKFEQVDRRLDRLDAQQQTLTGRLAVLEERVGRLEERLNGVEKRLDQLDKRIGEVERQQRETNDLLRQLLARLPGKS